ncbi:hypothetical protein TcasGA2_TC031828 [Tribolium castaneum]|uniref:Uncharacterized protein n=1 Tax=Tribolium castaneum TaxID=7070 RepID=A0A139W8J7_TRICA|nr:hypothetical protein TcasGA2_TC031828 [Tribolium castaneum]
MQKKNFKNPEVAKVKIYPSLPPCEPPSQNRNNRDIRSPAAHVTFNVPQPPAQPFTIHKFAHADWEKFQNTITTNLPEAAPTVIPQDINRQISDLTNRVISARDAAIPTAIIPKFRPSIPPDILGLIREKRRIFQQFLRTRDPFLKTQFNRLNAQIRRDINQHRENQWISTCQSLDYRDGKKFWNKFKTHKTKFPTNFQPNLKQPNIN